MPQTISEAIGNDHKYIDWVHEQILASTTDAGKTKWRNQLVWTFARHAISEELTMYPTMVEKLGEEGKKMTETDLEQHQAIKEDLYVLQSLSPSSPKFSPTLTKLMDDFHVHVEHESKVDMPEFEKILTRPESNALALQFQKTKRITPTRSHPSAPNKPYLENLAGLLAAPIDRLGDWVRSWPDEEERGVPDEEEAWRGMDGGDVAKSEIKGKL